MHGVRVIKTIKPGTKRKNRDNPKGAAAIGLYVADFYNRYSSSSVTSFYKGIPITRIKRRLANGTLRVEYVVNNPMKNNYGKFTHHATKASAIKQAQRIIAMKARYHIPFTKRVNKK